MSYRLIGKNFTPPDILGKVTGKAKFSEDFRAEGMVFCKLMTSPMPHARVVNIDASAALKMPGVVAVLTAEDVPPPPAPAQPVFTMEPLFVGDPILAVAAENETLAADALDAIKVEYEPLPYTVDPLQSLFPGGPNARSDGNSVGGRGVQDVKWTARDFAAADEGQLPLGKHGVEWDYGDIEAGFKKAKLVLDETFVTASLSHLCMEPRSAMAYWQNGKCYMHGSTQSQSFAHPYVARYVGVKPEDLVFISEYCGGGFGSKGAAYPIMAVPAHMSKKIGRPVMMRINRAEEYCIGSARPGFQGRIRMGFSADGLITAADLYILQENGPYSGGGDMMAAADSLSLVYTPESMRFRGLGIGTNTPPRGPQRGPGNNQIAMAMAPIIDKAAKQLGIDRVKIRRINDPDTGHKYGRQQTTASSSYLNEAVAKGAAEFDWEQKIKESGKRNGSKVIGIGVGQAHHTSGASGFDGLVRLTPDGKLHIHTGVGNLGTYSHTSTARVAAEVLQCDWENCVVEMGDSRKHLPWNLGQFGSLTTFTHSRTNYVAAMDAVAKLQEIAAVELGGNADDYEIADEKVVHKKNKSKQLTYAAAAQRAIELGGKFDGHEAPDDINGMTKRSVAALAGTGLIGVGKDTLERDGDPPALTVGFMQIELDLETGKYDILDYVGVADCGTVMHPLGMSNQVKGAAVMGIGMAALERHVYDPQIGLPANVQLHQHKPPSYLDVPSDMTALAVDKPDPYNPMGSKGIGEPVQGCAAAALLSAISDALGGHYFNRTPVTTDMILNVASGRPQSHKPLQVNTF
jgi:CO/xanthine dehydrogenase Mo-binding subunit